MLQMLNSSLGTIKLLLYMFPVMWEMNQVYQVSGLILPTGSLLTQSLSHVCCFLHHVSNILGHFELNEQTEQSL